MTELDSTSTTTDQKPTDQTAEAHPLAAGLRALADMVDANPGLVEREYEGGAGLIAAFDRMLVPVNKRSSVAALARAGLRAGAEVDKHVSDTYAGVDLHFGPAWLHVYADREEVCEKIVTGTREVTEEVPDPQALAAVPTVTVTKTVEDVEWRCGSLLAPAEGGAR